ncbi:hypothetical protein BGZ76_000813 [Entomortierella beljakovae]|nr:hypothetical protein BGZ76_000813 [Entomortierella beljakovae]
MEHVPRAELEKHKSFVRIYRCISSYKSIPNPPLYTNLYEMVVDKDLSPIFAVKLIRCNSSLKRLHISNIKISEAMIPQSVLDGGDEKSLESCQAKGQLAYPLKHLESTLQELAFFNVIFNGQELWRMLCPVSQTIWSLTLMMITGTLEDIPLDDLMFPKVTRLALLRVSGQRYPIEELIGRCPALEHLEIGGMDASYPSESLVHILQGTEKLESKKQREAREKAGILKKQLIRPQLSSLCITSHPETSPTEILNHYVILSSIRACSRYQFNNKSKKDDNDKKANNGTSGSDGNTNNYHDDDNYNNNNNNNNNSMYKGLGYREKSLRELNVVLRVLDDNVREAIETHRFTLEILKINIQDREDRESSLSLEWQGRVLRRLLRTCRHLKVVEFWDKNHDADVSWIVEEMLKSKSANAGTVIKDKVDDNGRDGRESDSGFSEEDELKNIHRTPSEAWLSPALETFTIKVQTPFLAENKDMTDYCRFNISTTLNDGQCANIEWHMPKQSWNQSIYDGSNALLGDRWEVFELFNEDESQHNQNAEDGLLQQFLQLIAPSQRLKTLQLGQLVLRR